MQDTIQHTNQQQVETNELFLPLINYLSSLGQNLIGSFDGLSIIRAYCASNYNNNQPFRSWHTPKSMIREGGSDPLEHIDVFKCEEDPQRLLPRHWHYIGYGLSDIYDYRRQFEAYPQTLWEYYPPKLSPKDTQEEPRSGFGIELTLRVRCHDTETEPPEWPKIILQNLARYIFEVKITYDVGDHIAFNQPLDGEESKIRHILMMEDPLLGTYNSPTGSVKFIQLVGVCDEELEAARQWNVMGLLDIMRERFDTGGLYMVTDMRRVGSVFDIDPSTESRVRDGISLVGSNMSSISTIHKYKHYKPSWYKFVERQTSKEADQNDPHESDSDGDQEKHDELDEPIDDNIDYSDDEFGRDYGPSAGVERGNILDLNREDSYEANNADLTRTPSRMSVESESNLLLGNMELSNARYLRTVYLLINSESAKIFPVVLRDRLKHRKCFTFQNYKGDLTTTFVPERSPTQTLASRERPMVKQGPCLHIFVSDRLLDRMIHTIGDDFAHKDVNLPRNYSWDEHDLHITVTDKIEDVTEAKI